MTKKISALWTDVELEAAVDAYLSMREMENDGRPFKKTEMGLKLREGALSARSKSAIELRMQNISSVLVELGQNRIKGYVPAKNVGANVSKKIQEMLNDKDIFKVPGEGATASNTSIGRELEASTADNLAPPLGIKHPKHSNSTVITFFRDDKVREWVLMHANGTCEGCGKVGPFLGVDGRPFLEVHHVLPLAMAGSDRIENVAALCPNCHRRCHLAADKKAFTESLYVRVKRLKEECLDLVVD
ncbi:HNH endonuclease signature motif containing protein [Pseudomonas sp. MH10]|uniref:HNH endonuclease n=1 Tax=Pseudomonas sp. MH10 TaxID=3048627 RepID=UPI002AC99F43|nr:HNH endonuclease signature motif containing protein [Pseudomonas sp. MH10]MEB0041296.1 HNH endonuclease signature motif containing protein [Pseudomonas sp. MH10]WPX63808.1 HNH endonuclease signature motif containing protein [Pseudomonas sp. MH10]